ncbi:MAG TPA: hypothetical protein VIX11_15975 [Candidatus Acidoferrum sp.]
MKKHQFVSSAFLLLLFLAVQTPQFAQDTSAGPAKADQERRMVAVSLVRTINTAEATYRATNGSFVVWKTLVSEHQQYFDKFLAMHGLLKTNAHFSDAPEILPSWNLRLNVHLDGQGYDVLLRDMTDDKCGYAALTDENGVIRQSKAIDCEI